MQILSSSMFPTGSAGRVLLVLRSVAAITILVNATAYWPMNSSLIIRGMAALAGLCLFLGFATSYCSAASWFLQLGLIIKAGGPNKLQLGMSALAAGVTFVWGPGGYSLDSRLFGQKLIKIPPGRKLS